MTILRATVCSLSTAQQWQLASETLGISRQPLLRAAVQCRLARSKALAPETPPRVMRSAPSRNKSVESVPVILAVLYTVSGPDNTWPTEIEARGENTSLTNIVGIKFKHVGP